MRKALLALAVLAVLAFSGCEQMFGVASSSVEITRTYKSGDYVYIYYEITNTGSYAIDYYEVFFDISTSGGVLTTRDNGLSVKMGTTVADWTMENIGNATFNGTIVRSTELTIW